MKNLLNVDNCKIGELEKFGLIEVYPYLHYSESEESNENDLQAMFQESLSINSCKASIHVRSKEAQKEIFSWLLGYNFENVKCISGDIIGQTECWDEYSINQDPQERQFYKKDDEIGLLISNSRLGLSVVFESDRVGEFKKIIKKLRYKKSFRNKWINEDGSYLIK